jgi:Cft2 family RNA processing exonuclease
MTKISSNLSKNMENNLSVEIEDLNGYQIGATTLLLSFKYKNEIIVRILIDVGLAIEEKNGIEVLRTLNLDKLEKLIAEKPGIEHIIITHAHEDHCGAIPWLIKLYREKNIPLPKIHTHKLTMDQFKIAQRSFYDIFITPAKNTGEKYCWNFNDIEMAYTRLESCSYRQWVNLYSNLEGRFSIRFRLYPNGHIVGSGLVEIWIWDGDKPIGKIIYTSDISLRNGSFLVDGAQSTIEDVREPSPTCVITEGTYLLKRIEKGDRTFIKAKLTEKIRPVLEKKGNVVLCVYSIDRASNILVCLREMKESGQLPPGALIFFDTTTGAAIDRTYRNALEEYFGRTFTLELPWEKEAFAENLVNRYNQLKLMPVQLSDKSYVYKDVIIGHEYRNEVIKNYEGKGCIIVATSATFHGGPVIEYLRNWGPNSNNLFLIMGGAIPGTKAERLVRKTPPFVEKIRVFDPTSKNYFEEEVEIRAKIEEFNIMSGHATFNELRGILSSFKPKVFLLTHIGARGDDKKVKEKVDGILKNEWGISNFFILSEGYKYSIPLENLMPFYLILDENLWGKLMSVGKKMGRKMIKPVEWKKTLMDLISFWEELSKGKGIKVK